MICVSLGLPSVAECLRVLPAVEFAEIRLDLMKVEPADVPALFACGKRLIAACRPGTKSRSLRKALLLASIRSGAAFVDIEHDADARYRDSLLGEARKARSLVILSFHDYAGLPPLGALERLVRKCFRLGADYVKVACWTDTPAQAARLLGILGSPLANGRLIVVGLGRSGPQVRVFAPFLGSPFTYASLGRGMETAPGQLPVASLAGAQRRLSSLFRE